MIVSIENLTFQYKKKKVYEEANLHIEEPGIYGLVAPNGAGKTTLLHLIVGLNKPKSGEIEVLGKEKMNAKEVSFVQDNSVLYPYLSGLSHLKYISKIHKIEKANLKDVIEKMQMSEYIEDTVSTYSLGMKQRLLLAMGLMKKPKILLLDEPLNGLDPTSTILMRETLLNVAKQGTTIFVSSHNLSEMDRITNNVFFIKNKKIIKENLEKLKEEKLAIEVENSKALKKLLDAKNIDYTMKETQFLIPTKTYTPYNIMSLIIDNKIEFQRVDMIMAGAEERYRKLFEEEFAEGTIE